MGKKGTKKYWVRKLNTKKEKRKKERKIWVKNDKDYKK